MLRVITRFRPRLLLGRPINNLLSPRVFSTTTVVSEYSSNSNGRQYSRNTTHQYLSGILALGVLASLSSDVFIACDDNKSEPHHHHHHDTNNDVQQQQQQHDDDDNNNNIDPYDNLPDEDEETDCSMCKTFRKGPCRPFWRKLERCFKDHEKEENGAANCMKYFHPHHQCLAQYTNLYQLVSLEVKQELVDETQQSVTPEECRKWKPEIDWTMWKRFCKEDNGLSMKPQTIPNSTSREIPPYWQRLPENTEPLLITLSSDLPQQDTNGLLLKLAFAVDQDGVVLGMTFNREYGKLMDKANGKEVDEESATKEESSSEVSGEPELAPAQDMQLEFIVLPGETKKVRVFGMYSENPVLADPDKDILDALLYKSRAFSLTKVAKEDEKREK